jgi:hypothetical protein
MMRVSILAGAALALVPAWAWAQGPSDYGPHMMWWGGGWYLYWAFSGVTLAKEPDSWIHRAVHPTAGRFTEGRERARNAATRWLCWEAVANVSRRSHIP